jgi:hypothetical protein
MNPEKVAPPRTTIALSIVCLIAFGLVACGPNNEQSEAPTAPSTEALTSLFLESVPGTPISVSEARRQLQAGDPVLVEGQIGGVVQPFLSGYAGFVLADTAVLFCNEMDDDEHCAQPWDACCEDPEKLQASRVSVQFLDAEGLPIVANLRGAKGLTELSHVVVTGRVAEGATADNMIIHADGLAVLN